MLNVSLNQFKLDYLKKKNQVIYYSLKSEGSDDIENLINNFLQEKNSFIFESVEKGKIKGRYTIFGKNPDKIWEFNNLECNIRIGKNKKKLKGTPKKNLEKIIENFKFSTPKELPPICSLISGYFSYDIIRYIENIPNKNKDDLNIPDSRILRPKNLVIHDNIDKKIYFIVNIFKDEKITNFEEKYNEIIKQIEEMVFLSNYKSSFSKINKKRVGYKKTKNSFVIANFDDISIAFKNLLRNALKYSPEEEIVFVKITTIEDEIICSVQDFGSGIAKTDQEKIFERFFRVDKGRSRKLGGNGLGLAIVKHAIERNNAEVSVESSLGFGSTFSLKFKKVNAK